MASSLYDPYKHSGVWASKKRTGKECHDVSCGAKDDASGKVLCSGCGTDRGYHYSGNTVPLDILGGGGGGGGSGVQLCSRCASIDIGPKYAQSTFFRRENRFAARKHDSARCARCRFLKEKIPSCISLKNDISRISQSTKSMLS